MQKSKLLWETVKLSYGARPLECLLHEVASVLYGLSFGATTYATQLVIRRAESFARGTGTGIDILLALLAVMGSIFLGFFLNHILNEHNAQLAAHIERTANQKLFEKMRTAEPIAFEDPAFLDRVESAFDMAQPIGYVGLIIVGIATGTLVSILSSAAVLYRASPWLALLIAIFLVPNVFQFSAKLDSRSEAKDRLAASRRKVTGARDMVISPEFRKETSTLGATDRLRRHHDALQEEATRLKIEVDAHAVGQDARFRIVSLAADVSAVALVLYLLRRGTIDIATFGAALTAILSFRFLIEQLFFNELATVDDYYGDLVLFHELLQEPWETRMPFALDHAPEIVFENVSFRYPGGEREVLSGLSLRIPAGESLAVVGFNGAGKSTLMKLACGLYVPSSGRVTIGGRDTRTYRPTSGVAAVFQDFARYKMRLDEAVAMGRGGSPEYRSAAGDAAREFLAAFPHPGLQPDTVLSREFGGIELSGGWAQMVAMLRASFHNGAFVLFDEPTSAIDPEKEHALADWIGEHLQGRTGILITHRMGLSQRCDQVLVLEGGQVAELGRFQDLYHAGGRFATYFREQEKWYGVEREDFGYTSDNAAH